MLSFLTQDGGAQDKYGCFINKCHMRIIALARISICEERALFHSKRRLSLLYFPPSLRFYLTNCADVHNSALEGGERINSPYILLSLLRFFFSLRHQFYLLMSTVYRIICMIIFILIKFSSI